MPTPLKDRIVAALAAFAPAGKDASARPADLFAASIGLFDTLGYDTSRQARLPDPTAEGFMADFVTPDDLFSRERARLAEWRQVELLFQLTQAEVINQVSLFDTRQVDRNRIETYLFWAIDLRGDDYTRSELAAITRELNRLFPMPCFVVFRYGDCLTLATIDRRLSKRDESRDVLEKITLIKSIALSEPHAGHIAILHDLSFQELYQRHHFDSFVGLHRAWQDTLNIALLNKRFYRELYTWYEWAALPESGVWFPRPAAETASLQGEDLEKEEDKYRRLSLIRLLTRVMFVWFLREKGLVPRRLFEPKELTKHLKAFEKDADASSSFYQGILQNLFFATLNTPMQRDVQARADRGEDVDDEIRRFVSESPRKGYSDDHTDQTKYRGAELFRDPATALTLFEQVPFLNGGLFECLDGREGGAELRYDGFSASPKKRARVPNRLFFGKIEGLNLTVAFGGDKKQRQVTAHGLVSILERYKFTVAENTPLEEEVALDPELLGKVFENLLATYNPETQTTARKLTGSFYTPREIVDYMVDQSLQAYLAQALPAPAGSAAAERLGRLFRPEDPAAADPNPFGADSVDTRSLIGALSRCRVLDPACGSGAFPMGVLHRMVALLRRLDPDNRYFQEEQLRLADKDIAKAEEITNADVREPAVRNAQHRRATVLASFEKDAAAARAEAARRPGPLADGLRWQNYARKLFLIENCIYGVDIQQIAVQIAKLRFFISLIAEQRVDEAEENRNILAMPNLETKFVAANTLVPLDKGMGSKSGVNLGTGLFEHSSVKQREKDLQDVRHQLFFARSYPEKKRLRLREKARRRELSEALLLSGWSEKSASQVTEWSPLDVMHPAGFFDAETMFGVADGFDVVIGNPPYGAKLDKSYKEFYPETSFGGIESYKFFIEKGLNLTKKRGTLAYITSDSYLEKESFLDLRKFLLKNSSRIENVKLGLGVFENVGLPTSLLFVNREASRLNRLFLADLTDEQLTDLSKQVSANLKELSAQAATLMLFVEKQDLLDKTGTSPLINHYDQVMGVKVYQVGKGTPKQTDYEIQNNLFVSRNKKGETWMPFVDSGVKRYYREGELKFINYGKWLAEPRELKYFLQPKILIREVVNPRIYAAYVEEPAIAKNTLAVIVQKSEKFNLKYLLSIINSFVFNHYIIENSPKGATKLFPSLNSNLIKRFPLKTISPTAQFPFIRLVEYVLWLKAHNPADSRAQYFERVLDGLVYELYFPAALKAGGCEVSPHLPPLPALPAAAGAAEAQLQGLYAQLEDKNHPVRKALFFMDTVEEVAIVEGKRK